MSAIEVTNVVNRTLARFFVGWCIFWRWESPDIIVITAHASGRHVSSWISLSNIGSAFNPEGIVRCTVENLIWMLMDGDHE